MEPGAWRDRDPQRLGVPRVGGCVRDPASESGRHLLGGVAAARQGPAASAPARVMGPREAIESAQAEAAATEDQRAQQRVYGARSRERQEAAYRSEFEDAVRRFLAFAPNHRALADEIAEAAARHAGEVGSGRVGRTRTLSLEERASLAARALIRHQYTSYEDDLDDAPIGDPWDEEFWYREIKTEAQRVVDDSSTATGRHRAAMLSVDRDWNAATRCKGASSAHSCNQ